VLLLLLSRQITASRTPSGVSRLSRWTFFAQASIDTITFVRYNSSRGLTPETPQLATGEETVGFRDSVCHSRDFPIRLLTFAPPGSDQSPFSHSRVRSSRGSTYPLQSSSEYLLTRRVNTAHTVFSVYAYTPGVTDGPSPYTVCPHSETPIPCGKVPFDFSLLRKSPKGADHPRISLARGPRECQIQKKDPGALLPLSLVTPSERKKM